MPEDFKPLSGLPLKPHPVDGDLVPILNSETEVPGDKNMVVEVATLRETFQGIQGIQGEQGEVGTQYPFRAAWAIGISYLENDCVEYAGSGYVCMVAHTSTVFDDDLAAENWALLVEKGDGTAYPFQGAWVTATQYNQNDCVGHDGSGYVCMIAHTSGTFATDLAADKWSLLVEKGDQGEQGPQGITGSNVNLAFGTSDTPPGGADDGTLYVVYT